MTTLLRRFQPATTVHRTTVDNGRLQSVDVLRALTMLLMVFVNDLDAVPGVPEWIKHVKFQTDGLGLADTVFPAFLFIVGLSVPLAIENRISKGDGPMAIFRYILLRGAALLVMGFFHVNLESYNRAAAIPKAAWEIGITVAFFLIWMDYPRSWSNVRRRALQLMGWLLLAGAALTYRGGSNAHPEGLRPEWWGILGLIGWSYLICAPLYWASRSLGRTQLLFLCASWTFFFLFDLAFVTHHLQYIMGLHKYVWIVGNGSMPAFTMGGVILTVLYKCLGKSPLFWFLLIGGGVLLILLGFGVRPYGGISKLRATPSWIAICSGITTLTLGLFIWMVDLKGKMGWFNWVRPAGTSTLACYLIPYLLYSLYMLVGFHYPRIFNEGTGGLIRSIAVALFCVWITGVLERRHIRLKL